MEMQAQAVIRERKKVASIAKKTAIISEFFILSNKPGMILVDEHEKKVYCIFEIIQDGNSYYLNISIGPIDGKGIKKSQQLVGNTREGGIDLMVKGILEETLPTDMNYERNSENLREILTRALEESFS